MQARCSHTLCPGPTNALTLRKIWHVKADPSYDVKVSKPRRKEWVAVRTIAGRGALYYDNGNTYAFKSGTLLLFEHNRVKRYLCNADHWHFWWFEFDAPNPLGVPVCELMSAEVAHEEVKEMEACFGELRSRTLHAPVLAGARLVRLLLLWSHQWARHTEQQKPFRAEIEAAVQSMHANLSNVSISRLAKAACLSERRFRQVFAQYIGASPKKYYDDLRLNQAAALLGQGRKVGEVAYQLGFSSPFHFSRVFKDHFGVAPSGYLDGAD